MQHLLNFYSDLILFVAGTAVSILVLVIIAVIAIELHDAIFGINDEKED